MSSYPELVSESPLLGVSGERVWYLAPRLSAWPAEPVPANYVVLPKHVPGTRPTLEQIPRLQALEGLLEQSVRPPCGDTQRFEALVELVRGADCYALTVDSLEVAIEMMRELAET
jgi:hypothetical protein